MKMKLGFVVGLVAFAAIYVTGCGDNPEKQRVMPSSLNKLKTRFSSNEYLANSGNSFKIDSATNAVEFKSTLAPQRLSGQVMSATSLRLLNEYSQFLFEIPIKQSPTTEASLAESEQAEANPLPAIGERFNFEILCQMVRSGTLTNLYERPTDLKIKYEDYTVLNLFQTYPLVQTVAVFDIGGDNSSHTYSLQNLKEENMKSTLTSDEAKENFNRLCAADSGYDNELTSFFHPANQTDNSSIVVPLVRFDKVVFQTFDLNSYQAYVDVDSALFSTQEVVVNTINYAKKYFDGTFQSGRMVFKDEYVAEFDEKNMSLQMNFADMTFTYQGQNDFKTCTINLSGTIQNSSYSSRRAFSDPNTYMVNLSAKAGSANDCLPEALKGKDLDLVAYIASSQTEGEISVTLLDQKTQTKLVSRQSFVKR